MSLFGTFGRKGKKHSMNEPQSLTSLDLGKKPPTGGVYSSTPNLNKLDHSKYGGKDGKGTGLFPISNANSQSRWNFETRRTSSSVETWTGGVTSMSSNQQLKQSTSNLSSSPSMKHLNSFISAFGSLRKKSKSSKKLGFGSTLSIASKTSSREVDFSKKGSFTSQNSLPRLKLKSSSKSEEALAKVIPKTNEFDNYDVQHTVSVVDGIAKSREIPSNNDNNNEPGVISSGSSSASMNIEEGFAQRASSERANIQEESDEDSDNVEEKDPQEIERQKTVLLAIKKFNMDPKKGIEYLVEKGILKHDPLEVAEFLKYGMNLSKASIGDYLGERQDFNEEVLKAFVEIQEFKGLILVQALREFLWSFRLPGESQKISRMLDTFAERYCQTNEGLFSSDTCSVLCYSIIMLNTELHNPNVKDKVTLAQFIKRNRGIEGGEALNMDFMVDLYNSILMEPFQFPQEDGNDLMLTFFNPDIEGWLYKLSGRPKSWKRLWFILNNNCLYFFKFTTDKTPRGIIPLENILVKAPEEMQKKFHIMILYKESPDPRVVDPIKTCKTLSDGQTVPKLYTSIHLGTPIKKDRDKWAKSINANHSMSHFYSDLTLRKLKKGAQIVDNRIRKSQIGLPSTTSTGEVPVPEEVLLDPRKNPENYFRNLNEIPTSRGPLKTEEVHTFPSQAKLLNLAVSNSERLTLTTKKQSSPKKPSPRITLKELQDLYKTEEASSRPSPKELKPNLVVSLAKEKNSRLSMILESSNTANSPILPDSDKYDEENSQNKFKFPKVSIDTAAPVSDNSLEQSSGINVDSISVLPKLVLDTVSEDNDDLQVDLNIARFPPLSENYDCKIKPKDNVTRHTKCSESDQSSKNEPCHSIEVIDCCSPTVKSAVYSRLTDKEGKNQKPSDQQLRDRNIAANITYYDSIYESNV